LPDTVTPQVRSRMMGRVRSSDTKPEMTVRRLLHSMGYRFRLHRPDLPGRPDISFSARRRAVEVRGCFWHQHPNAHCPKATIPATRRDWWAAKLRRNVERDLRNELALRNLGWALLVLWECELHDTERLRAQLTDFLGPART